MGVFGDARRRLGRWLRSDEEAEGAADGAEDLALVREVATLHDSMIEATIADRMKQVRSVEAPKTRVFRLDLVPVAEQFGPAWEHLSGRALLLADRVLRRRTNDQVAYVERSTLGVTFALTDPELTDEVAAELAEFLIGEILRSLLGGEAPPDQDGEPEEGASLLALGELLNDLHQTLREEETAPTQVHIVGEDGAPTKDDASGFDDQDGATDADPSFGASGDRADATQAILAGSGTEDHLAIVSSGAAGRAEAGEFGAGESAKSHDFAVSGDRAAVEFAGAWDGADDGLDSAATMTSGGDATDETASIVGGGERADAAGSFQESRDRPAAAVGDFGETLERPEALGEFGETEARATPGGDFGATDDKPTAPALLESGADRPDAGFGVGESRDRPVRPPLFGPSGELAVGVMGFSGGGDPAERPALVSTSEDRAETPPASFAETGTRADPETIMEAGGDRPEESFDVGASDTKAETLGDFGTSDERPTEVIETPVSEARAELGQTDWPSTDEIVDGEAAVPTSTDRPEETAAEFDPSRTRDEAEGTLIVGPDVAEGDAMVGTSGDRAEAPVGEFGASETRAEALADFGETQTIDDAVAAADFGATATRETTVADFGATSDRPDPDRQVGRSETRADPAAVDFGSTETRPEAANEFTRSDTREERELAVPLSTDRVEKTFDHGRSEERVEVEQAVVQTRTRESTDPITLIKAPTGKAGRVHIAIRFAALLDTANERVTTYLVDPQSLDAQNNAAVFFGSLDEVRSEEVAFEIDCLALMMAMAAVEPVFARGGKFVLALPVSASTLLRPKARLGYLEPLHRAPEAVRRMTRLCAYNTMQHLAPLQLDEMIGHMRSHARAPFLSVPPEPHLPRVLANRGVYGVVVDAAHWADKLGADTFSENLKEFTKRCHAAKIRVAVQGADRAGRANALAAGCDYVAIARLDKAGAIPLTPPRVPRAKLAA